MSEDNGTGIARMEFGYDVFHGDELLRCACITGSTVLVETSFVADTY